MASITVADLQLLGQDAMGAIVVIIYGRKPPEYAVYRTAERVLVQFADADDKASEQRKALARLNPLRGEINGLIDGWRNNDRKPGRKRKAERYDRRVGDALVVAFEGDIAGAELLLKEIRQDILNDRVALARFQYLIAAFLMGAVSTLLLHLAASLFHPGSDGLELFRAAATGTVGAFFSIVLGIRGRTVLPDLQWVSNMMDAVLRMVVGLIAGSVLMAFVTAGVVNIDIGGLSENPAKAWLFVLIVGFIAGFSERFVPDLLAKTAPSTEAPAATKLAEPSKRSEETQPAARVQAGSVVVAAKDEERLSEDAALDACLEGMELDDDEVRSDADLPPASGGVARPEAA